MRGWGDLHSWVRGRGECDQPHMMTHLGVTYIVRCEVGVTYIVGCEVGVTYVVWCEVGVTYVVRCEVGVTYVVGCEVGVTYVVRCEVGVSMINPVVQDTHNDALPSNSLPPDTLHIDIVPRRPT